MVRTKVRILLAGSAMVALCALASMPASAQVIEQYAAQFFPVGQPTDVISVYDLKAVTAGVTAGMVAPDRLPAAPGGVSAKVITCTKITDNAKDTMLGGASGLLSAGIHGPTTA